MNPKRPIRDLERQLRREPDNLALRLTLAAAYREVDRAAEALALYRSVARAYAQQGRSSQAAAVCRSALEIAPEDGELYGLLVHLERVSNTRPPPVGPTLATSIAPAAGGQVQTLAAPGMIAPPEPTPPAAPPRLPPLPTLPPARAPQASTPPPAREDNPMLSTVKRVPPPPPRSQTPAPLAPLPRVSSTDLDTPLPPPLPLHDARDSFVEMPPALPGVDESETIIPLTVKRAPAAPAAPIGPAPLPKLAAPPPIEDPPSAAVTTISPLSLSSSSSDERPSAADFAAEMVTRRRPKLSPHDLDLLSSAGVDGLSSDLLPALPVDDPAFDPPTDAGPPSPRGGLDEEEPTTPPAAPPPTRARTADDFADRGTSEFGGQGDEPSFVETLAQLGPDGAALEGPLGAFARLPGEAAHELARRAVVKSYDPGEVVIREGDVGDACYIIVGGEVAIRKRAPDGEVIELARLGDGALFGEFALLADRRRHATVVATAECEIYEIPRLLLRELAAAFPAVGPALEAFYRERLLSNLMATTPLFHAVPVDHRAQILARFHPMHVESGDTVVRQGERAGGLYLIVLGAVEVIRDLGDRRATLLASLGEGAYFGEMSLLSGGVASSSVVAAGPCELAVLPPHDFYEIVAGNPALWTAMRSEAEARRLANAQILTGRTGVV